MKVLWILLLIPLLSGCLDKEKVREHTLQVFPDAVFWKNDGDDVLFQTLNKRSEKCELTRVQWNSTKITSIQVIATKPQEFCESMKALVDAQAKLKEVQAEYDEFKHKVCPGGHCWYQ